MATDDRSRDLIQSIERGVHVLRAFGGRDTGLSVSAVAAIAALPRPVVRRILLTYEHLGYARSHNGVWALTPRILELGSGYFASSSLPEIAYPVMGDVVETTGETCSVGVLDGTDVIHVARVEERRPLPDAVRVGTRLPAHATAVGKVILASLSPSALADYFDDVTLEQFTSHTITDPAVLRTRLAVIRDQGYEVSVEELHPGMLAAAVPIVVDRIVVGGITVSSTTVRATKQSITDSAVAPLHAAAERIARMYRAANPEIYRSAAL